MFSDTHTRIALSMLGLIAYQVKGVKVNVKSTLVTDNPAGVPCAYVSSSVFLRCSSVSSPMTLSVLSDCVS